MNAINSASFKMPSENELEDRVVFPGNDDLPQEDAPDLPTKGDSGANRRITEELEAPLSAEERAAFIRKIIADHLTLPFGRHAPQDIRLFLDRKLWTAAQIRKIIAVLEKSALFQDNKDDAVSELTRMDIQNEDEEGLCLSLRYDPEIVQIMGGEADRKNKGKNLDAYIPEYVREEIERCLTNVLEFTLAKEDAGITVTDYTILSDPDDTQIDALKARFEALETLKSEMAKWGLVRVEDFPGLLYRGDGMLLLPVTAGKEDDPELLNIIGTLEREMSGKTLPHRIRRSWQRLIFSIKKLKRRKPNYSFTGGHHNIDEVTEQHFFYFPKSYPMLDLEFIYQELQRKGFVY